MDNTPLDYYAIERAWEAAMRDFYSLPYPPAPVALLSVAWDADDCLDVIRNTAQVLMLADAPGAEIAARHVVDEAGHLRNFARAAEQGLASASTWQAAQQAYDSAIRQTIVLDTLLDGTDTLTRADMIDAIARLLEIARQRMTVGQVAPAATVREGAA